MSTFRVAPTLLFAFVLALITFLLPISSSAAPAHTRIDLPTRSFYPPEDGGVWLENRPKDASGTAVILQFHHHPDTNAKRALARSGVVLQVYIGGGAWVAWVGPDVEAKELAPVSLRWAGPLLPEDRIAPRLAAEEDLPAWAVVNDRTGLYAIRFMNTIAEDDAEALLQQVALEVGDYVVAFQTWYILASHEAARQLAHEPGVLWVDVIAPPLTVSNLSVRATMHVNEVQAPPYGLSGLGVIAGVYDGGMVDIGHPDFGGRASFGEGGPISDHPTHVAGTLGSNGPIQSRGMAPGVSILSYNYENCDPFCLYNSPQDIWENYSSAVGLGARLITNSIGANVAPNGYPCAWLGDYELTSALLDSVVRGGLASDLVVLFAAGNERIANSPCGTSYGTMSIPAGAKNVITVGASTDSDAIASFSSFGPTDDGRMKPEVVGNGVNVYSTTPGGSYGTMSGTSMSTPATAGVTALLMEALNRQPEVVPLIPPLFKALLVNGADDLGLSGPDYQFGFGRVNAQTSVDIINLYGYNVGEVEDDGEWMLEFEVQEGVSNLKVTLAWSDPPAVPMAARTLVNDLDLHLVSPISSTFFPFLPDPENPGTPAGYGRNDRDVVEQVFVADPVPGTWRIIVTGFDVPVGPQDFAVVATVPLHDNVARVVGHVTDAESGDAIEGASVRVSSLTHGSMTDAEGEYQMHQLLQQDIELICSANGYTSRRGYLVRGQSEGAVTLDFALSPAGRVTVSGVVYDEVGMPAVGAEIVDLDDVSSTTTSDLDGEFSLMLIAGEMRHLRAELSGLTAYANLFTDPIGELPTVELHLQNESARVSGPDYHGYIAIQNGDGHPLAPEYLWVEIDPDQEGAGTRIDLPAEETPVEVELPFSFQYYGVSFDTITVNENGFFFFGGRSGMTDREAAEFANGPIPGPTGPAAMVAPFWEDFRAEETNLSVWHDEEVGRFIVEWYDSRQWPTDGTRETFQVILYDPAEHPTATGDGWILFQYADVNDLGNATVGIESPDGSDGLGLLYYDGDGNGSTLPTIGEITDGTAILFLRSAGLLEGVVTLVPADPEVQIDVRAGSVSATCEPDGSFQLYPLFPGVVAVEVSAPGYELLVTGVEVLEQDNPELALELWRLSPPTEVVGTQVDDGYMVSWQPPDHQPGATTSFQDRYHVYRNGSQVVELEETSWTDDAPFNELTVYWVTALYSGGESDSSAHVGPGTISDVTERALPLEFAVSPVWPNPFNPSATVRVALPTQGPLRVDVIDLLGRHVATLTDRKVASAGYHRLAWDASRHASGLYFIRVQAGKNEVVRKAMLVK